MGILDPEYTGKVTSVKDFEEEAESRKMKKEASKKQLQQSYSKLESNSKQNFNKENEDKPKGDAKDTAKGLLSAVNTNLQNDSDGGPPPSPFASALQSGITSGGNPAAIGGAFLMGVVKSMQYKEQQKLMGQARAKMEEAKGEKEKGAIALRMGDAVSRALGSSGRKRSINI